MGECLFCLSIIYLFDWSLQTHCTYLQSFIQNKKYADNEYVHYISHNISRQNSYKKLKEESCF